MWSSTRRQCGVITSRVSSGPHARALLAQPDRAVLLVDDAVTPGAGPGEVLVRVQAFSVCARDRAVLRGRAAALRPLITRSQLSIGRGFAGVVLDAGPGVSLELGDEVWGCVSEWSGGAASELLTIRSTRVSKRPRGLAADTAASLPWAGSLALEALDKAPYGLEGWKGKRVAIIGATTGEGLALLQLLSRKGARACTAAPQQHRTTLHDFDLATNGAYYKFLHMIYDMSIHEAFIELWQNELFVESRERVGVWTRDAVQRIKDGAPPLSPVLLYEELVALFKDRSKLGFII
ncbi:Reticulon-4-interacting protein 1, mitochondrial [Papilio xuthus]|uniref:Reticulon-4-interacting protein 1, mitochondrial n=1 Tax=Papilio xuthus TaxID=66420 RepID=A0A0N1PIG7_PAPXU|nr:Reticulon-4-interacting protein 1, mitochondrial [Papilio xuthus]